MYAQDRIECILRCTAVKLEETEELGHEQRGSGFPNGRCKKPLILEHSFRV